VEIKVFACDAYGECTINKPISGIHVCDGGCRFNAPTKVRPSISKEAAERIQPATHMDCVKSTSLTASVRLDTGEAIEALNVRSKFSHKGKRCVVGMQGDKWVLLQ
jgi:hypothetical protein